MKFQRTRARIKQADAELEGREKLLQERRHIAEFILCVAVADQKNVAVGGLQLSFLLLLQLSDPFFFRLVCHRDGDADTFKSL